MKKCSIVLFFLFFLSGIANADIIFYDSAENSTISGDERYIIIDGQERYKISNCRQADNSISVSSEQAYSGEYSYKLYVQPYDPNETYATNCSINLQGLSWMTTGTNNFNYNEEYWIGYAIYIPNSYQWHRAESHMLVDQMHGVQDPCDSLSLTPNIAAYITTSGKYSFVAHGQEENGSGCIIKGEDDNHDAGTRPTSGTIPRGEWHTIAIYMNLRYDDQGETRFYINGNEADVFTSTRHNCYEQTKGPYWMLGPYGHPLDGITVYYDEIRVGNSSSSLSEVTPQGGSPDTDPPVRSSGSPSGTLNSGTTSTNITLSTNENATCKYDTDGSESYASMANTFSTTGGQSHSQNISGLSDGNSYTYYVRCTDGTNANTNDYSISFSIDSSTPGRTNLVTNETIENFVGDKSSAIYDGCTDDYGPCLPEDEDNDLVFEIDLGALYDTLSYRFYADAVGSRVSKTLTIDYKQDAGDSWTNFETDTNVLQTGWIGDGEIELTGITARYLRVTVESDTGYTQFREMELFGEVYEEEGGGGGGPSPLTGDTMTGTWHYNAGDGRFCIEGLPARP
jgi:hypothetical protein